MRLKKGNDNPFQWKQSAKESGKKRYMPISPCLPEMQALDATNGKKHNS